MPNLSYIAISKSPGDRTPLDFGVTAAVAGLTNEATETYRLRNFDYQLITLDSH